MENNKEKNDKRVISRENMEEISVEDFTVDRTMYIRECRGCRIGIITWDKDSFECEKCMVENG